MADKKISALTASSTPLAGTEVLPIVQSGATVKVSVANLTAGRDVAAAKLTPTDNLVISASGKGITTGGAYDLNFGTNTGVTSAILNTSGYFLVASATSAGVGSARLQVGSGGPTSQILAKTSTGHFATYATGVDVYQFYPASGFLAIGEAPADGATFTERTRIDTSGNFKITTGNLVVGTAGKGIDFSANGGDVLSQYDEGTWTPVATGITINSGTPVWSGTYTRVGRTVVLQWALSGGANIDIALSSYLSIPFTALGNSWGSYGNVATNTHIGGIVTYGALLYFGTTAAGMSSASGTITIQI